MSLKEDQIASVVDLPSLSTEVHIVAAAHMCDLSENSVRITSMEILLANTVEDDPSKVHVVDTSQYVHCSNVSVDLV